LNGTRFSDRRSIVRTAAGLGTIAVALGATAAGSGAARAAVDSHTRPATATVNAIRLNTANWSGSTTFGTSVPGWFKDSFGVVHLEGAAKQVNTAGSGALRIGTLPRSARPSRNVFVVVYTLGGSYADLEIAKNGNLTIIKPHAPAVTSLGFVSLEDITYRKSASGANGIALNSTNFGRAALGSAAAAAFKDASGIVHLQGAVKQISAAGPGQNFVGTLPQADRPSWDVFVIVNGHNGTYADAEIGTNGNINLTDPFGFAFKDFSFVSLEGISYSTNAGFNSLAPPFPGFNSANWSANAGSGTSIPGWIEDENFAVHLQGAVTQTSPSGNANQIVMLPQTLWPTRTVYTIVPTNNGTYAGLFISTTGQVNLFDPASPMTKDYSFVSLEGVAYHP
jgi:hypothetical protein